MKKTARCLAGIPALLVSTITLAMADTTAWGAETAFKPLAPDGQSYIHDPSTIVLEHGIYHIFGTGPGIRTKTSSDLIHWTNGDSVFDSAGINKNQTFQPGPGDRQSGPESLFPHGINLVHQTPGFPAWIKTFVPAFRFSAWAPDVIHVNGKYLLYYAASSWGKQVSAIGLATNPTLDSGATNYLWSDAGPVITSTNESAYNTIDPSVMRDADGKLWLAFGSFWQGIFLTELDPQTGLRMGTNSQLYHLAWNDSIEAACLTRHDQYYYLFVNWGQCCKGTNSTYEVRVGRADKVTGPYLDRDGKRLADGGGSVFLQTSGRFIGPGHIGILDDGGKTGWFSFHYYDGDTHGRSRLALGKLDWPDGWPKAVTGEIKN